MDCMDEKTLSAYLDEDVLGVERTRIEGHISQCRDCLDLLIIAYEAQSKRKERCPALLNGKIKKRLGLKKKRPKADIKWLWWGVFFFVLSFVFKRYFLQLLVGAGILGFKWAMESEGARKVVMIFKGMQRDEKYFERKRPPYVSSKKGGDSYGERQ